MNRCEIYPGATNFQCHNMAIMKINNKFACQQCLTDYVCFTYSVKSRFTRSLSPQCHPGLQSPPLSPPQSPPPTPTTPTPPRTPELDDDDYYIVN